MGAVSARRTRRSKVSGPRIDGDERDQAHPGQEQGFGPTAMRGPQQRRCYKRDKSADDRAHLASSGDAAVSETRVELLGEVCRLRSGHSGVNDAHEDRNCKPNDRGRAAVDHPEERKSEYRAEEACTAIYPTASDEVGERSAEWNQDSLHDRADENSGQADRARDLDVLRRVCEHENEADVKDRVIREACAQHSQQAARRDAQHLQQRSLGQLFSACSSRKTGVSSNRERM